MLILERAGILCCCILKLQIVRLCKVNTPASQKISILLLESLTNHEICMVKTEGSIISQRILNQRIGVLAMTLCQLLITLIEVYTVTLNPGRDPSPVIGMSCTIRQIQLIGELMVLALNANHIQQINIGRSSTYETVNKCITLEQVIHQQRVSG